MKTFRVVCVVLGLATISAVASDEIRAVQQQLKDEGYFFADVTGNEGKETSDALRRYQIRNGLEVTGKLDEKTRAALQKEGSGASTDEVPPAEPAPVVPPPANPPQNDLRAPADDDAAQKDREFVRPENSPPPPPPVVKQRKDDRESYTYLFRRTPYETAPDIVQHDTVRRAKARLAEAGYYLGKVDEFPSAKLADALRAFQARRDMEPTGRLDMDTLNRLRLLPHIERPDAVRGVWLR